MYLVHSIDNHDTMFEEKKTSTIIFGGGYLCSIVLVNNIAGSNFFLLCVFSMMHASRTWCDVSPWPGLCMGRKM